MITVKEAKTLIRQSVNRMPPARLPLLQAAGYILAEEIRSPLSLPPFDQSAMDGYAFRYSDWNGRPLQIEGEQAAGSASNESLLPGTAMRIFTGAALPPGADTVVMQEKVLLADGLISIEDDQLTEGSNVRKSGAELNHGEIALEQGSLLVPAALGLLASMGLTDVTVYPPPAVSILITGNELQDPGAELSHGQVYESNSFALRSALNRAGVTDIKLVMVPDDPASVEAAINEAIKASQMLLLTGGVSVGDYDFVVKSATKAGIRQIFHKIKQRPGKPLFFGTTESCTIFGLPGNPGSVLTCFYEYVFPAICQLMGRDFTQAVKMAVLQSAYSKPAGLTCFVKARYDGSGVLPLDAQESFRMRSFAVANALIVLEEGKSEYIAGEQVEVHPLPL